MQRLTEKSENGYCTANIDAAIGRLGRFEDMYESLLAEQAHVEQLIGEALARGGKRSVSYKQLLGMRLTLDGVIQRFSEHLEP